MPTRSLPLGASVVLCMVAAAGCGDGGGGWVPASADPRRNVLVIDDGFDLTAPELGGRVAAAYTVVCEPGAPAGTDGGAGGASNGGGTGGGGGASGAAGTGGDGGAAGAAGAGGAGETFADRKQRFIAALAIPDERCGLAEGVRSKPRPLGAVARYRQRWNDMLRRQRDPTSVFSANEWAEITAAVNTELGSFPYHGTSTAGTITHLNPEVRLVLVELDLGTDQSVRDSVTCIEQAELDEAVALLADPEVRDAYVSRPASRLGRDIAHLAEVFRVGIVNESFGTLPRAAVEQVLQEKGCPAVDLVPYFTTYNEADQARAAALAGRPMVQVQAAGNDATQIDAPWDSRECAPGRPTSLLVGSYDLAGRRSSFSNFGACVDVYAPGEWVVVPYPGGWLLPVFGTSFSAPLTARLVSLSAPSPFEPAGARAALVGQRLADGSLPLDLFPPSFFYVPETGSGPRPSPLTASQAAPGGGAAPRAAPMPGLRARPTRRRFDPRPLLEPLQRLRQISGRRISLFR